MIPTKQRQGAPDWAPLGMRHAARLLRRLMAVAEGPADGRDTAAVIAMALILLAGIAAYVFAWIFAATYLGWLGVALIGLYTLNFVTRLVRYALDDDGDDL